MDIIIKELASSFRQGTCCYKVFADPTMIAQGQHAEHEGRSRQLLQYWISMQRHTHCLQLLTDTRKVRVYLLLGEWLHDDGALHEHMLLQAQIIVTPTTDHQIHHSVFISEGVDDIYTGRAIRSCNLIKSIEQRQHLILLHPG